MIDSMADVVESFRRFRIIPVIVIEDPKDGAPLAAALSAGGLPCAEITLRTPRALDALRSICDSHPDVLAGAGTVLSEKNARDARAAGARFVVSPGFNRNVVDYCRTHGIPVFPGACTPTEITAALEAGMDVLKFFPAEAMGGVSTLKAISAPFSAVRFIPTGGITPGNIAKYMELPNVVACGGSWMAPASWIAEKQFERITNSVREALNGLSLLQDEKPT
ncbi:MAG: bifunctional 4-hydroxy-2-oxoglutarate aldolase/2-dehydro-3-deoxy-phosphogluconate aldolase [Gemmatimonadaceae bacterium]|nr:bifunctional 4-hydroxy-2-oxoglutarate aldolase/2-dehydro-3-deoxy-phosphogluconate aldolase [Gemmatimonadaceae bacterium]